MEAVASYQRLRLSLLADLSFQAVVLEALTGSGRSGGGGRRVPFWSLHGMIAPTMLPLLVLISVAAFLPVSEIAQVGRQLADTIASTRRLAVVQAEPVLIRDGGRGSRRMWRSCDLSMSASSIQGGRRRRCGTCRSS